MKTISPTELILISTDTVVGLAGAVNPLVARQIFTRKHRPATQKLVIAIGTITQLACREVLTNVHYQYIRQYWPGPTTLIINGQAYRMPRGRRLLKFLKKCGPLYLTSANLSATPPAPDLKAARRLFPDLRAFNFGPGSNLPSTILDTATGEKLR